MAKENVNVADELKDERQKTNLAQSAKETDKTQVIAGTDTDDEVIETTEENETQLPKIYVKRKRYTNKTDGKQYWEYVTSAMMRGSVSEVHFKASDVGGYEALEKLFGDDNKALELKVREERQYDEKTEKISDQNYYRSGIYDHIEVPACRRVAEVRTLYGSVPGCRI